MSVESSIDFPAMHSFSDVVVYAEAKDDSSYEKGNKFRELLIKPSGLLNKFHLFKHNCDFSKDMSTSVCDKGFTFLIRREINSLSELCRSFFHPNFLDLHVHASIMNHVVVEKGTSRHIEIPAYIQFLGEPKDSIKLNVDRAPSGQYKIKYIKKPTYEWSVFTHFNEGENEITKALETLLNSGSESDFHLHAQICLQSKPASPNQKPSQRSE